MVIPIPIFYHFMLFESSFAPGQLEFMLDAPVVVISCIGHFCYKDGF